ncbi:recombinase family protein [Ralstonia pseudosolanacearum]
MLYGYARVSTQEQETHAQTDALAKAGVGFIFAEKRSGGSMSQRPQLEALLQQLSPGDTVVVYKLDRIARSLKDLLTIIERIEEKGAQFRSLTESLDTSTPAGRMIFHIVGAFAEFERELIRERTRVGMAKDESNRDCHADHKRPRLTIETTHRPHHDLRIRLMPRAFPG